MTRTLSKIKNNNYCLYGYFSWVHVKENHEIYLYESVEGDIIPVTQVEHQSTITNDSIELAYIGRIHKFIKIVNEQTFYQMMLYEVGLSTNPIDAWIYLIMCLINKTTLKTVYPSYYGSELVINSRIFEEHMIL